MTGVDAWRKMAVEQIKSNRLVTDFLGLSESDIPYSEYPNYAVYECNPDTKLNENNCLISGTEPQIILQSSLIKALYQILGHQLGYTIDFDLWFEDFSLEFKLDPVTGQSRIPITTEQEIFNFTFWGKKRDECPKFEYLDTKTNENRKKKAKGKPSTLGYRVIKFWKNRKAIKDFYILGGTPTELREQIFMLMYINGGAGDNDIPTKKIHTELKQLSSSPTIYLIFREERPPEGEQPLRTEVTINLIDCVENSQFKNRPSDKVIGVPELKEYVKKIKAVFLPGDEPYILKRGKEIYTYARWGQGYHTWVPFLNKSIATAFYQKMVSIKSDTFDDLYLYEGRHSNPQKKYQKKQPYYVMGEQVTAPNYRREGDLKFWKAYLWLPQSRQKITLVSRSKRDPVDYRLV